MPAKKVEEPEKKVVEEGTAEPAAPTATSPVATSPVPATIVKKKGISLSLNLISFILLTGVLGYLTYATWNAATAVSEAPIVSDVPTPSLPVLKLNQANKREGPTITVDQGQIGKDNPFSK